MHLGSKFWTIKICYLIKDNTGDVFRRWSWENLPENKIKTQRHGNYKRKNN